MSKRSEFDDRMNSLIGSVTGKKFYTPERKELPLSVRREASQRVGGLQGYSPSSRSSSSSNPNYTNVDVAPNFDSAENAPELVDSIKAVAGQGSEDSGNALTDFLRPIKNVGKEALGRVGDVISRPLYGVYNGYVESKEAQLEREENQDDGTVGFDFGNLGSDISNYGSGFLKGFTGAKDEDPNKTNKVTPGNAVELFTKKDFDSWEESGVPVLGNSTFQTWTKRTAGFAGEIWGDPANLVGGKAVGVFRNGARTSSKAARSTFYKEVAEKVGKDNPLVSSVSVKGGVGSGFPGRVRSGTELLSDTLIKATDDAVLTSSGRAVAANTASVRGTIVAQGVSEMSKAKLKKFDQILADLQSGKIDMDSVTYKNAVKSDDFVKQFDDAYKARTNKNPMNDQNALLGATATVKAKVQPYLDELSDSLDAELRGSMYNTFAIRVGNSTLPIKVLGKGLDAAKRNTRIGAPTALSINKQLPGKALQQSRYARAAGHAAFEDFRRRASPFSKLYTKVDRDKIGQLIHDHPDILSNPELLSKNDPLYKGVKFLKDENERVLRAEVDAGTRSATDGVPANYQHILVKPSVLLSKAKREALEELKEGRKTGKSGRTVNASREGDLIDTLDMSPLEAKNAGFPVSSDPFEAMSHRVISSERRMSKSFVTEGFFRTYGISGKNVDPNLIKSQGWVKIAELQANGSIKGSDISRNLRGYVTKSGEDLYLPKDAAEAFKYYQNITKVGAKSGARKELDDALEVYDKLHNLFKVTATMPYPGFHVKNMAGDIFMGLMDGVGPRSYSKFIRERGLINKATGSKDRTTFNNAYMSNKMADEAYYYRAGSSGYLESEILPSTKFSEGVKGAPRLSVQKARGLSEWREDVGRRVHFNHALEEELKTTWPTLQGKITPSMMKDKRFVKALDNTTYRVDKFKFDYGALTATEKNVMRRTIPFYTFMRKSGPMMLEGMLTNPSLLGKTQRTFPAGGDGIPGLAPWQRELGLANITGGDEPLIAPETILPYDQLLNLTRDPLSIQNYLDFVGNSAAPLPKTLAELAFDKNLFTGGQLSEDGNRLGLKDSLKYLAEGNFAPVRSATGVAEDLQDDVPFDFGEFLGGSRFALGLGVRKLRDEDQKRNLKGDVGYVKRELSKLTEEVRDLGVSIYLSERTGDNSATSVIVRESIPRTNGDGNQYNEIYEGTLDEALTVFERTVASKDRSDTSNENVKYVDPDKNIRYGPRGSVSGSPENRILERD
jgi:hypothetical protein